MSNIPPGAPGDMIIVQLGSPKMRATLERFALAARLSLNDYGQRLFEAAYSARCAPTGDRALDQAVAEIDRPASPLAGAGAPSNPPNQGSGGVRPDQSAIVRLRQDNARLMAEVARLKVQASDEEAGRRAAGGVQPGEQASLKRMTQGRSPIAPPESPRRQADALSGAMVKQIRGLAGIGKTPLNIADMLGLEIEVVKAILARRAA